MFTKQLSALAILPLLLLGLSGCRDAGSTHTMAHDQMLSPDKAAMHEGHGAMEMPHKNSKVEPVESVALPENFPSDMPVYPGARVAISSSTADGATIGMETEDDRKDVVHYYETELVAQGWKLEKTSNSKFKSILQGKKTKHSFAITINERTKLRKTTISVIIKR